jgi:hypothetical protein
MHRAVDFWTAAVGYEPRECQCPPGPLHQEQARHVERLIDLGATRAEQWPYLEDADFVVRRDPDGKEFCIIAT